MNLLHIITGLNDGGAEAVLFRLCTHDTAHRHTVISLTDMGKYGPLLHENGIRVHCLNLPRGRVTVAGLLRLIKLVRQAKPDVVQTWMYHADLLGGLAARMAGIRRVCWGIRHSTLEPDKMRRSTLLTARICSRLSHQVPSAIACCSDKAAAVHQALGYPRKKFTVIPNGYDLTRFRPDPSARAAIRNELGIHGDETLLGMVGRYDPQKNHRGLIDALALLAQRSKKSQCILIGNGMDAENSELLRTINAQGLEARVRLLGPRNDIANVMNGLDLHVLSSAYGEAFPNVLAEAMACGTPCVTTDVGDASLILGDTGWVVPPRQAEALAQALSAALEERNKPEKWKARQVACRTRIQNYFGIERMVSEYGKLWQGVAEQ